MTSRPPTERLAPSPMGLHAISADRAREIVASAQIHEWHAEYVEVHARLARLERGRGDPFDDLVWQIGRDEEQAAAAESELMALECSFETLSQFEQQCEQTARALARLQAAQYEIESCRDRLVGLREHNRAIDRLQITPALAHSRTQLTEAITETQQHLAPLDAEVTVLLQRFAAQTWRKESLWREVSDAWMRTFCASMRRSEFAYRAVCGRAILESGAGSEAGGNEPSDTAPGATVAQWESRRRALSKQIKAELGCLLIDEFLYWPKLGRVDRALCVPLFAKRDHLNIQLRPLAVYEIDCHRGLEFIEPVSNDDDILADDYRLDAFFVIGRPERRFIPSPALQRTRAV